MRWLPDLAKTILVALALAATAPACSGDDSSGGPDPMEDPPPAGGTLAERECPAESFLTYQNFGAPFFSEYCTGCHSSQIPADMRQEAPPGVDFETLDGIRGRADLIYMRAADGNAAMPPVGGPAAEARALLGEWLACGAPE